MSDGAVLTPVAERERVPTRGGASRLLLQRKCACGAGAGAGGECESCAAKSVLQRSAHGSGAGVHDADDTWPASVSETLGRAGRPLDPDTRSFMEERFAVTNFGGVRVHDDTVAASSARDMDADAYTVGQHVVFGEGQYRPHSDSGRHLLAHELAHTVQQQGLQRSGTQKFVDYGPEYHRLEAEADRAAERVMQGGAPQSAGLLSASGPRLSRKSSSKGAPEPKDKDENEKPTFTASYDTTSYNRSFSLVGTSVPERATGTVDKTEAAYKIDTLVLPPQKGAKAVAHCMANLGSLGAAFDWSSGPKPTANKAGRNEARDPTETLQRSWLATVGYKLGKDAHARWSDVGGDKVFPRPPVGPTCELDHIQELQVGGTNAGENLQVLDKVDNASSGGLIQQQLRQLAEQAFDDASNALGGKRPKRVSLNFGGVVMQGAPVCGVCCKLAGRFVDQAVTAASEKATVDVEVSIVGKKYVLKLPADKSRTIPLDGANAGVVKAIKGMTLANYERDPKGKGHDKIRGTLDENAINAKPGTKSTMLTMAIGPDGTLQPPKGKLPAPVKAEFSKLSPITFTTLSVDADGVSATGTITPRLPLLPELDVALDPQGFRVGKALDPDRIKPPFPGMKVTEVSIMMELAPAFKPVGTLAIEFGTAKKLADLKLKASADDAGLVLKGDLFIYIPGVDQAKGNVTYQAGQWSGGAHIEATKLKLPFVKGGAVDVSLKGGKLDAGGKVNLELPGKNEAALDVQYSDSQWVFKGRGRIVTKSKYLQPIDAAILVRDDLFRATGSTGIAFAGLEGDIHATYEQKAGVEKVYGKGSVKIQKGRAKGAIDVELHADETLTGKGKLSYEIKKDMVASAGIVIDDKQKITFDGELSFPDITLFPRFPKDETPREIFSASGKIPIPGASIGPIGLKVELYGGLGYYYYVGPGVLTGIRATAKFSPFEPDPDFAFSLKAKASIPAGGGITGTVGANVVIDAMVAEVGGGLSVDARAGLKGKAELGGEINYAKDRFSVDASAYIGGSIELGAALRAKVFAEAGVWKAKVRTEKIWTLKETKFDTGLTLGLRMPLHYDSVEGLRPPALADIKPEPPELKVDPGKLLGHLFGAAKSEEKES
ncbi:eCIS core domain-containing protein [Paraburkholderia dipogonis]|uniref:eCIS core domain-containing protein n=1 Tax=Paraburkholderia dipogonis TaxID=1211383 RepID=UPI0038BA6B66